MNKKYQIFEVISCVAVLLFAFNNCSNLKTTETVNTPTVKKLTFAGVGSGGIFDPSITKDPATGKLWMSYSAVEPSVMFPTQNKIAPHTRLAYSTDSGDTWTDAGAVNAISDVNLPLAAPNNAGTWMNEVSTLVYDPGAAPAQRWKLMWQTFMKINAASRYEHSWIAIKMASSPENLAAATAVKLFTSYLYDTGNNNGAGATSPPIAGAASIQIDTAFAQMSTCIVAEPSLHATASALYMSLQCEQFNDPVNNNDNDRLIVLFKCASPCNVNSAASWTYLGRLFNRAESTLSEPFYNGGYAAPALVETAAGMFLLVTPTEEPDALYRGCTVFKFTNLDTAQLQKSSGIATVIQKLEGTIGKFRGACGYHPSANVGGVMLSELSSLPNGEFQIFQTRTTF